MSSGLFKNFTYEKCLEIIYSIYMYKEDLALNNLQSNQTKPKFLTHPSITMLIVYSSWYLKKVQNEELSFFLKIWLRIPLICK